MFFDHCGKNVLPHSCQGLNRREIVKSETPTHFSFKICQMFTKCIKTFKCVRHSCFKEAQSVPDLKKQVKKSLMFDEA